MSKSIAHMFVDITTVLEDVHGVAVEGQHPRHILAVQRSLVDHLRSDLVILTDAIVAASARSGRRL